MMRTGTLTVVVLALGLTMSAQALATTDRADRIAGGKARIVGEAQDALARFTEEVPTNCASAHLQDARDTALMAAHLLSEQGDIDNIRLGGGLLLDVAEAARQRGCHEVASRLYDLVGSAYAEEDFIAIRARAEAGIAALPAEPIAEAQ